MASEPFDEWDKYAKQFEEMTDKVNSVLSPVIEQLEREGEKLGAMAMPFLEQFERHARVIVHQQAERALDVMDVMREQLEKFVRTGGPEQPLVD